MTSSYRPPGVNSRPEVTSLASRRVVEYHIKEITIMTDRKFNEHDDLFDKVLILMTVGDKTTQDTIHKAYMDFNSRETLTFNEFRDKINELWNANFPKVLWYDIRNFIDKVLYDEDVPERCEELPIRISVGNRYLEIPMDPVTQVALEKALKQFSVTVNDNYD